MLNIQITENQYINKFSKNFVKNLLKKFANPKNCRTFVSGMRKQGSLDGIILLVISFSVINYVVSKSVRLRQADTLFFMHIRAKKRDIIEKESPHSNL